MATGTLLRSCSGLSRSGFNGRAGVNRNSASILRTFELHFALGEREQGEVSTDAHVGTREELGAALANDDGTGLCNLTTVKLDATILRLAIATVSR